MKNLLSTASRHSPEDSAITVTASRDDVYVAISVSTDGGRLISAEPHQLFQKLSKNHPQDTASAGIGGDGLALAICKGIVEVHGGRLRAERGNHGRGITFTFTIPMAVEAEAAPENQLPVGTFEASHNGDSRILIAIKETRIVGAMRRALTRAGYSTSATYDLTDVERLIAEEKPHLVFLDMTSPNRQSFEMLQRISSGFGIPVLCLCESRDEETAVRAFDVGADGYITAPLSPTELVARVNASLRSRTTYRQAEAPQGYVARALTINYAGRTVSVSGQQIQLTATEYKLIFELSSSAGRILTQDELLQRVWGTEYTGESQLLRSYIKSLRQKLGDNARQPTYIFTEHGIGYRMAKP